MLEPMLEPMLQVDLDPLGLGLELARFFVPGAASPEPRPRFSTATGRAYVPSDAHPWKHQVRASAVERLLRRPAPVPLLTDGALVVRLVVWRARPASHLRKGGQLRASAPRHATSRPDQDNTTKAVLDALGAWDGLPPLVWRDDAQVIDCHETKLWCTAAQPRAGAAISIVLLP